MTPEYDLIVIGAGPGGYEAALKAADRGMRTALIEKDKLGGTCLNSGCIPTKTIMHITGQYRELLKAGESGLCAENVSLDMKAVQSKKEAVCEELRGGIAQLLKKGKVDVYKGTGKILDRGKVRVQTADAEQVLVCGSIIIATGSAPSRLPVPGADLPGIMDSTALLNCDKLFEHLIIVGGGVIGMEFASVYTDLGRQVTVLEAMDRILPGMDKELGQNLKLILKKRGADIHTGAFLKSVEQAPDGSYICSYEEKGKMQQVQGDGCLIAVGRRADAGSVLAEDCSGQVREMNISRGTVCVDSHYQSSVPGIYAIGDVSGGIQLAHAASAAAVNCVAYIAGEGPVFAADVIPSCVYTSPEIASVGISADDAKKQKLDADTKKYPMSANGKSVLTGQDRGFIKITADNQTGRILGAQLMCANATDMICFFTAAIANGLTTEQLSKTVFAHPTFSEGIGEALRLF